jgi:hypothetical protein
VNTPHQLGANVRHPHPCSAHGQAQEGGEQVIASWTASTLPLAVATLTSPLYLELLRAGLPATLIDPHGDLAELILAHLVAQGVYQDASAFARILYLDVPGALRRDAFLPMNVLKQPADPHTIASNIKEAMHRAWPALAGGMAPMFDTLVQDGVKVLISNDLPITGLYSLLTNKGYRERLLQREDDGDVVSFFHDQFDRLSERDRADQAGAALRRAHLLTFAPVLKYSLGQRESVLNFRDIMDRGSRRSSTWPSPTRRPGAYSAAC